jgi:transcriptional regulator with XRE-family HTH domain
MISLKALRKERSMTQQELADALGLSKSTVAYYETGRRAPNIKMIHKICDFFGCTSDYLLCRTTYPYQSLTEHEDAFLAALDAADQSTRDAALAILSKYMEK